MSRQPDVLGIIGLYLGTKKILPLESLTGWARESLPNGGFLALRRYRDGKSWIVEAYAYTADLEVVKSDTLRAKVISKELVEAFAGNPAMTLTIPETEA